MKSEKRMETNPPQEIKLGGGEQSVSANTKNWDALELMVDMGSL